MRQPMFLLLSATAAAAALFAYGTGSAADAAPSPASVEAYVTQARQLAGDDLKALLPLCQAQPAVRASGPALEHFLDRAIAAPSPPPGKAFDNLYFVGDEWVSAWAINTSRGIILIDALNTGKEAAQLIEGGLRRLGLNPARIKYIVVTHGHGDHYGGATYSRTSITPAWWRASKTGRMMETKLEFETPLGPPPKRDMSVKDGDTITLGDTTVTLYLTPGHTLGTLSPVFDVTLAAKGTAWSNGAAPASTSAPTCRLDATSPRPIACASSRPSSTSTC